MKLWAKAAARRAPEHRRDRRAHAPGDRRGRSAHAAGIVHRDLKPENIFLARTDDGLEVKVLDFGIAKLSAEHYLNQGQSVLVTEAGSMLGTPCYMAPEQISNVGVDHRADIWSLGVILYECLSGTRPIEGQNLAEVVARLLSEVITPLDRLAPELPHELSALVQQMLSRDAKRRPQDLHELSKVLGHYTHVRVPSFGEPREPGHLAACERVSATPEARFGPPERGSFPLPTPTAPAPVPSTTPTMQSAPAVGFDASLGQREHDSGFAASAPAARGRSLIGAAAFLVALGLFWTFGFGQEAGRHGPRPIRRRARSKRATTQTRERAPSPPLAEKAPPVAPPSAVARGRDRGQPPRSQATRSASARSRRAKCRRRRQRQSRRFERRHSFFRAQIARREDQMLRGLISHRKCDLVVFAWRCRSPRSSAIPRRRKRSSIRARALMKAKNYAEACPKLAESQRLDPGIGTQFHLADCYENQGKLASAWATFLEVASLAAASNQPDREKAAKARAARLEPRLPRLTIVVPADEPRSRPAGHARRRRGRRNSMGQRAAGRSRKTRDERDARRGGKRTRIP